MAITGVARLGMCFAMGLICYTCSICEISTVVEVLIKLQHSVLIEVLTF